MNTDELHHLALEALNDLKAIDLITLDVREFTTITDSMIICSGRSTQHVKSIAENVVKKAKESKVSYIKIEGEREGEWVIVDLADIVVHIMLPSARAFYYLEDLWQPLIQLREQNQ